MSNSYQLSSTLDVAKGLFPTSRKELPAAASIQYKPHSLMSLTRTSSWCSTAANCTEEAGVNADTSTDI